MAVRTQGLKEVHNTSSRTGDTDTVSCRVSETEPGRPGKREGAKAAPFHGKTSRIPNGATRRTLKKTCAKQTDEEGNKEQGTAEVDAVEELRREVGRLLQAKYKSLAKTLVGESIDGKTTSTRVMLALLAEKKPRKEPEKRPRRSRWVEQLEREPRWKGPDEAGAVKSENGETEG